MRRRQIEDYTMSITVHQFACLKDNYGFLVRDDASGLVACIDTPDADAVLDELDRLGWSLAYIFNTHWHPDHAGGNAAIKAKTGALVIAPPEVEKLSAIDRVVADRDIVDLGETPFEVIETGGHTLGHIIYYSAQAGVVFVGDTLFPMGCGRLFEGTAAQMWESLSRIAALPPETTVYSAHEYTLANARFALSVDKDEAVAARAVAVAQARDRGEATVPTTIAKERATNPFLRAPLLLGEAGRADPVAAFARIRAAKDVFAG
jgi:hydroxyacylglutathione hydrolase